MFPSRFLAGAGSALRHIVYELGFWIAALPWFCRFCNVRICTKLDMMRLNRQPWRMIQKSLCHERCVRTLTRLMAELFWLWCKGGRNIVDLCNLLFIHSENLHSACSRSLRGQTNDSNEVLGVTDESLDGLRNIYSFSLALWNFRLSNGNETSIIRILGQNDPMTLSV